MIIDDDTKLRPTEKFKQNPPTSHDFEVALDEGVITLTEYAAATSEEQHERNYHLALQAMLKMGIYEVVE